MLLIRRKELDINSTLMHKLTVTVSILTSRRQEDIPMADKIDKVGFGILKLSIPFYYDVWYVNK